MKTLQYSPADSSKQCNNMKQRNNNETQRITYRTHNVQRKPTVCKFCASIVRMFEELDFDEDKHYYLICGDMNAHTQERDDIIMLSEHVRDVLELDEKNC